MDIWTVAWIAATLALAGGALYVYRLTVRVMGDRLMRCPETGAITLVGVKPAKPGEGAQRDVAVEHCTLWPEKAGCAQDCLERYHESSSNFPVNTDALRPFQRH